MAAFALDAAAQDGSLGGALGSAIGGMLGGKTSKPAASAPSPGGGHLGIVFRDRPGQAPVIASLDPVGPAAAAGLAPGDVVNAVYLSPRDFWASGVGGPISGAMINDWVRGYPPGRGVAVYFVRDGQAQRQVKLQLSAGTARAAASTGAAPAPDDGQAAYDQLCGPGRQKLSATTCASMKRDLDQAASDEVSTAYRQFCAPGAETLSQETCQAMRADLTKGATVPRTAGGKAAGRPPVAESVKIPPPSARAAELGDAYAELCAIPEPELSAATCAALRADASVSPAPKPKPRTAPKAKKK